MLEHDRVDWSQTLNILACPRELMDGAVEWGVCNPLMNNSQGHSRDSGKAGQSMGGGLIE